MYADAFQSIVMVAGQLVAIGVGVAKLNSASDAWDLSWDWDRIQVLTRSQGLIHTSEIDLSREGNGPLLG